MTETEIQLIDPCVELADECIDFLQEFDTAGENEIDGAGPFKNTGSKAFAKQVQRARDQSEGRNLPDGYVPGSTYWLVRGRRILGTCNLRHELNNKLRAFGGHIGYSVRPSERNKGYATLMLKLALEKARELGIERALVTCEKDNIASVRVIEKNGGVLDSENIADQTGKMTQRYWIELSKQET